MELQLRSLRRPARSPTCNPVFSFLSFSSFSRCPPISQGPKLYLRSGLQQPRPPSPPLVLRWLSQPPLGKPSVLYLHSLSFPLSIWRIAAHHEFPLLCCCCIDAITSAELRSLQPPSQAQTTRRPKEARVAAEAPRPEGPLSLPLSPSRGAALLPLRFLLFWALDFRFWCCCGNWLLEIHVLEPICRSEDMWVKTLVFTILKLLFYSFTVVWNYLFAPGSDLLSYCYVSLFYRFTFTVLQFTIYCFTIYF